MQDLNSQMEFDHVVEVHTDGSVTDAPRGVYAPESPLDPDIHVTQLGDWRLMNGYSGQDRYAGPWMHASESIGGQMERDILAEPGYYVAILDQWTDDDSDEITSDGWAVAYRSA